MEAIKGDLTMAQISSQYGVHASQINRWKKEAMEAIEVVPFCKTVFA
jgi:transposase-like protein